jgi:hypothetical protein
MEICAPLNIANHFRLKAKFLKIMLEMSFMMVMKDKTHYESIKNVLHDGDEGHFLIRLYKNCPS